MPCSLPSDPSSPSYQSADDSAELDDVSSSKCSSTYNHDEIVTLNVVTLTGKNFQVAVYPTDSIADVKRQIFLEEGIPADSQILIYRERALLDDESKIYDHRIMSHATIQLVLQTSTGRRLRGSSRTSKKFESDISQAFLFGKSDDEYYILEVKFKKGKCLSAKATSLSEFTISSPETKSPSDMTSTPTSDNLKLTSMKSVDNVADSCTHDITYVAGQCSTALPSLLKDDRARKQPLIESFTADELSLASSANNSRSSSGNEYFDMNIPPDQLFSSVFPKASRPATAIILTRTGIRPISANIIIRPKTARFSRKKYSVRANSHMPDALTIELKTSREVPPNISEVGVQSTRSSISRQKPSYSKADISVEEDIQPINPNSYTDSAASNRSCPSADSALLTSDLKSFITNDSINGRPFRETSVHVKSKKARPKSHGYKLHKPSSNHSPSSSSNSVFSTNTTSSISLERKNSQSVLVYLKTASASKLSSRRKPVIVNSASQELAIDVDSAVDRPALLRKPNCHHCHKRIKALHVYPCKCGLFYCSTHRYPEKHGCRFDYRLAAKVDLERELINLSDRIMGNKV